MYLVPLTDSILLSLLEKTLVEGDSVYAVDEAVRGNIEMVSQLLLFLDLLPPLNLVVRL